MGGVIGRGKTPGIWGEGSGYKDGIYYSKRPAEPLPDDPYLDITTYVFRCQKYLDRVALVDAATGESLKYREVIKQVRSVAAGLVEIGVKQGDVMMILSPNTIQYPVLMLAVASLGAVVTAVNPLSTTKEIVRQVRDESLPSIFSLFNVTGQ
jgi:acyl-CoA synthetase (AMP-forming)/AMP-acid ligase II